MADAAEVVLDQRADLALGADHDLRGGRRRRRAQIGDEIRDREVALVPDAGDGRNRARGDRSGHDLLVERPEVLERASAAADQHDVVQVPVRQMAQRRGDLARRVRALHAHRVDLQMQPFEAAADDVENVADGRALRAGDDGDARRQHRDGLLALGIEEPLLGQAALQLLEGELERAQPGGLGGDGIELELALLLVDRQAPAHDQLQSVLDAEAEEARRGREHHHAHRCPRVLDREVEMPRRRARVVRHLAFDRNVVVAVKIEVDLADQLADLIDALGHSRSVAISGTAVALSEDAETNGITKRSHEMKADTLLKKTTATLGAAALAMALGACSTHRAVDTTAQTTGEIRTEQSAQNQVTTNDQVLGTTAAPANTQGAVAPSTPAVISGPASVEKSGNVYTSSAVGSVGNGSGTGLNTNVNIKSPRPASESSVVVTQSPATTVETTPAPVVVETTPAPTPAPVVVETPAPAPVVVETAPVVVETTPAPAPAPVVTETTTTTETVPMASSTTTTTTETTTQTKHKRMRKDYPRRSSPRGVTP